MSKTSSTEIQLALLLFSPGNDCLVTPLIECFSFSQSSPSMFEMPNAQEEEFVMDKCYMDDELVNKYIKI